MRIIIHGNPGTGKTTLAQELGDELGLPVYHTDDYLTLPREQQHEAIAKLLDGDDYIVEGTSAAAGLRAWHRTHENQPPPCDRYLVRTTVHREQTPKQQGLNKGLNTVHGQISDWAQEVMEIEGEN